MKHFRGEKRFYYGMSVLVLVFIIAGLTSNLEGGVRGNRQAKEGEITVNSLKRGYGSPSYQGILELRTTAEGIAIINELPVENYLCRVVPSEMPSGYEIEALKAQAVCARSYAYRQMAEYGYAFQFNMTEDDLTELMMSMSGTQSASYDNNLQQLGYADFSHPSSISIYPKDFDNKEKVVEVLDHYNQQMEDER